MLTHRDPSQSPATPAAGQGCHSLGWSRCTLQTFRTSLDVVSANFQLTSYASFLAGGAAVLASASAANHRDTEAASNVRRSSAGLCKLHVLATLLASLLCFDGAGRNGRSCVRPCNKPCISVADLSGESENLRWAFKRVYEAPAATFVCHGEGLSRCRLSKQTALSLDGAKENSVRGFVHTFVDNFCCLSIHSTRAQRVPNSRGGTISLVGRRMSDPSTCLCSKTSLYPKGAQSSLYCLL